MVDNLRAIFDARGGFLTGHALEAAAERSWFRLLGYVNSEDRLSLVRTIWPVLRPDERSAVLARALSDGDLPSSEWTFLRRALREARPVSAGRVEHCTNLTRAGPK